MTLSIVPEFQFVKLAEQADHYGYNALVLYVQALYTQTYYSKSELAEVRKKDKPILCDTHNVQLGRTVVDEYLLLAKNTSLTTPEYEINEAEIEKQLVEKVCCLQKTFIVMITDFDPLQQSNRLYEERTGEDILLFHFRSNFTVERHQRAHCGSNS